MFITIGDVTLNPVHIVSIEDDGDELYVYTLAASSQGDQAQPYYLIPRGEKADAFRAWLIDHSRQLLPRNSQERAWVHYRARGGMRDRTSWLLALERLLGTVPGTLAELPWWNTPEHQQAVLAHEPRLIAEELPG